MTFIADHGRCVDAGFYGMEHRSDGAGVFAEFASRYVKVARYGESLQICCIVLLQECPSIV